MSSLKSNLKKPNVPLELLQWLQAKFPDRAPSRDDSERHIWIKVGHIEVIQHLEKMYREQEGP